MRTNTDYSVSFIQVEPDVRHKYSHHCLESLPFINKLMSFVKQHKLLNNRRLLPKDRCLLPKQGEHQAGTRQAPGRHQAGTRQAPGRHQAGTRQAPGRHQAGTRQAPGRHQAGTRQAPGRHQAGTRQAPGRHQAGTRQAPGRHQAGTRQAPGRHQAARAGIVISYGACAS